MKPAPRNIFWNFKTAGHLAPLFFGNDQPTPTQRQVADREF
jgi:hypothetical protein